jgi:FixJ family two-component response regulator
MTQICVVDDDEGVRSAIALLLTAEGYSVRSFASGIEFLSAVGEPTDVCVVLDVQMPGMSGLDLMERLAERGQLPPVIVLTGHADVPMAVQAMKRGALDFLQKPFGDEALLGLVRRGVAQASERHTAAQAQARIAALVDLLTPREREVMEMVVQGKANKVVAIDMGISERTVEIHRAKLMHKLGVRSVADLVKIAARLPRVAHSPPGSD